MVEVVVVAVGGIRPWGVEVNPPPAAIVETAEGTAGLVGEFHEATAATTAAAQAAAA